MVNTRLRARQFAYHVTASRRDQSVVVHIRSFAKLLLLVHTADRGQVVDHSRVVDPSPQATRPSNVHIVERISAPQGREGQAESVDSRPGPQCELCPALPSQTA